MLRPINRDIVLIKQLSHSYSMLVNSNDYRKVAEVLKYSSLDWSNRTKNGRPTVNYYSLIGEKTLRFRSGVIPYLQNYFQIKFVANTSKETLKPTVEIPEFDKIKWFRDQIAVFNTVYKKTRGIIKHPTGSGKTLIASGLIKMYNPAKCIYIVHTQDLLNQTAEEFNRFFDNVGMIGDGNHSWSWLTVATIQSLVNCDSKIFSNIDMVICDESHHVAAASYRIIDKMYNAGIRYGLTATPIENKYKTKKEFLYATGLIGEVVSSFSSSSLIKRGRLSVPSVIFKEVPFQGIELAKLPYRYAYTDGIVRNSIRNRMILETVSELKKMGTVLITVREVRHGEELERIGAGVLIQGKTESDVRKQIKSLFRNGKIKSVIATSVWDEGTDIPALGSLVFAGGGLSKRKTIQIVGRSLRVTENKNKVTIVDFFDTQNPYLRKHSKSRKIIYEREGWNVLFPKEKL